LSSQENKKHQQLNANENQAVHKLWDKMKAHLHLYFFAAKTTESKCTTSKERDGEGSKCVQEK
jgi:hypothetical protein